MTTEAMIIQFQRRARAPRRDAAKLPQLAQADRLIEDLAALIDAGLVTPFEERGGQLRYAVAPDVA